MFMRTYQHKNKSFPFGRNVSLFNTFKFAFIYSKVINDVCILEKNCCEILAI